MRTVQLREAKAQLSALVQAAENGETTTITKHGRPAALVTPVSAGQGTERSARPNLIEYLMSMPEDIPIRRNKSRHAGCSPTGEVFYGTPSLHPDALE